MTPVLLGASSVRTNRWRIEPDTERIIVSFHTVDRRSDVRGAGRLDDDAAAGRTDPVLGNDGIGDVELALHGRNEAYAGGDAGVKPADGAFLNVQRSAVKK